MSRASRVGACETQARSEEAADGADRRSRRRTTAALALLTGAILTGPASCSTSRPAPSTPNLVLIVVDTLRRDALGCYGSRRPTSPAVDAFAAEAIRFER